MILCLIGPESEFFAYEFLQTGRVILVRGESEMDNFCITLKKMLGWDIIYVPGKKYKYSHLKRIGPVISCINPEYETNTWPRIYDYEVTRAPFGDLYIKTHNSLNINYFWNCEQIFRVIKLAEAGDIKKLSDYKLKHGVNILF